MLWLRQLPSNLIGQRDPADRVTDLLARLSSDHPAASREVCQLSPPLQREPHPADHLARLPSDHQAASYGVYQLPPPPQPAEHPARLLSDHPAASYEVCQPSSP